MSVVTAQELIPISDQAAYARKTIWARGARFFLVSFIWSECRSTKVVCCHKEIGLGVKCQPGCDPDAGKPCSRCEKQTMVNGNGFRGWFYGYCQNGHQFGLQRIGLYSYVEKNSVTLFNSNVYSRVDGNTISLFNSALVSNDKGRVFTLWNYGFFNMHNKAYTLIGSSFIASVVNTYGGVLVTPVSVAKESFYGISSSLVNYSRDFYGIRVGGFVNFTKNDMFGFEISLINITDNSYGLQLGIVNKANEANGLQVGVVNIADKLKGFQIGLANIVTDGVVPFLPVVNFGF